MEARPPEREAIMPRFSFRSRAYQFAQEPESLVRMTLSGKRGDNSQVTRCGLTLVAVCFARFSSVLHHDLIFFAICVRQDESVFCSRSGSSAQSDSAASPTRVASKGNRNDSNSGARSICKPHNF